MTDIRCGCCDTDEWVDMYPATEGPDVPLCTWCADGQCSPACVIPLRGAA